MGPIRSQLQKSWPQIVPSLWDLAVELKRSEITLKAMELKVCVSSKAVRSLMVSGALLCMLDSTDRAKEVPMVG